MVSQCISEDKALNGLNHSSIHKLGTLVELEVNSGCVVYIIRVSSTNYGIFSLVRIRKRVRVPILNKIILFSVVNIDKPPEIAVIVPVTFLVG